MKAQLASLAIMLALLVLLVPFPESRPVIGSFNEECGAVTLEASATVNLNVILQSTAAIQGQPDAFHADARSNPSSHEEAGPAISSPRMVRTRETETADTPVEASSSAARANQTSRSYQSGESLKTSCSGRIAHGNSTPAVQGLHVGLHNHGILAAGITRRMKISSVGSQEPRSCFEELVSPTYDPRLSSGESSPSAHLLNDQYGHPVRPPANPRVRTLFRQASAVEHPAILR
ncbi:MAG: hypothetical protein JXA64_04320 [Candidatus Fermentibacteraceae bacterium]|nr:hypothetical protein [Candidatus Fermentibacteraceae bacterium]MBN2608318.1 hypothetical protein [Candidatus Fermentibacteraceae bacterium]